MRNSFYRASTRTLAALSLPPPHSAHAGATILIQQLASRFNMRSAVATSTISPRRMIARISASRRFVHTVRRCLLNRAPRNGRDLFLPFAKLIILYLSCSSDTDCPIGYSCTSSTSTAINLQVCCPKTQTRCEGVQVRIRLSFEKVDETTTGHRYLLVVHYTLLVQPANAHV